jgi:hypothetical protein
VVKDAAWRRLVALERQNFPKPDAGQIERMFYGGFCAMGHNLLKPLPEPRFRV